MTTPAPRTAAGRAWWDELPTWFIGPDGVIDQEALNLRRESILAIEIEAAAPWRAALKRLGDVAADMAETAPPIRSKAFNAALHDVWPALRRARALLTDTQEEEK